MRKAICGQELLALNGNETLPYMTDDFISAVQQTRDFIEDINASGQYAALTMQDGREIRIGTLFMSCGSSITAYNQLKDHHSLDTRAHNRHLTRYELI